jgi:hypothetical protein
MIKFKSKGMFNQKAVSLLETANELAWAQIGKGGPCFGPNDSPEIVERRWSEHYQAIAANKQQADEMVKSAFAIIGLNEWGLFIKAVLVDDDGCWAGEDIWWADPAKVMSL